MKASFAALIATVGAIVLSGSLVAPARATNINFTSHDCQQSDPPQTDISHTVNGVATLPEVATGRYVTCSVARSPLASDWTFGWFYVDGDNRNGAQTSCTLSSYTFFGTMQGSVSFTALSGASPISTWYDQYLSLPAAQMGYWDYLTLTCLLPAHGDGVLRGITAGQ